MASHSEVGQERSVRLVSGRPADVTGSLLITCGLRVGYPEETAGRVTLQILTCSIPRVAYHLIGFTGSLKLTALKCAVIPSGARNFALVFLGRTVRRRARFLASLGMTLHGFRAHVRRRA